MWRVLVPVVVLGAVAVGCAPPPPPPPPPPPVPPAAVSDLEVFFDVDCVTPATTCSVFFDWQDNATNETGFDVFVFSAADPQPVPDGELIGALPGTGIVTSGTYVMGVDNDTCISIIAYNDAGDSDEVLGCFAIDTSTSPYGFVYY